MKTKKGIYYSGEVVELSDNEMVQVKDAVNASKEIVDLVRDETRLKLNLKNFIKIIS